MRYLISVAVAVAVAEIVAEVSAAECTASDSTTVAYPLLLLLASLLLSDMILWCLL